MGLETHWFALMIGNTNEHWAEFRSNQLVQSWHHPHQDPKPASNLIETYRQWMLKTDRRTDTESDTKTEMQTWPELWLASVVPALTSRWLMYPNLHLLSLADIPLKNCYPTLGIDRVLGAWGAGMIYGWPVLLIDGGTALTITGIDSFQQFQGGIILPGLGLMATSLTTRINTLPKIEFPAQPLPQLWGHDTPTAIQSGIFRTVLAGLEHFIQDWQQQYPTSQIVFTGGDGLILKKGIEKQLGPALGTSLIFDPDIIIQAIALVRNSPQNDTRQ